MSATRSSVQEVTTDLTTSQCLFVADSGDRDARVSIVPQLNTYFVADQLYPTSPTSVASSTVNVGNNAASYSVTAVGVSGAPSIFDQAITIQSTCAGVNAANVEIATKGTPTSGTFFSVGACGCESLDLQGSVTTDSYRSAVGGYASQTPGHEGNIGTDGSLSLGGSVNVDGKAYSYDDVNVGGSSDVTGTVYYGGAFIGGAGIAASQLAIPPTPCKCAQVLSGLTRPSLTPTVDTSVTGLAGLVTNARTFNDNASIAAQIPGADCGASSFAGDDLQIQGNNCHISVRPDLHSYVDPLSGETKHFSVYYLTGLDIQSGDLNVDTSGLVFNDLDRDHGRYKVIFYLEGGGLWDLGGNGLVNNSAYSWILEAWHYMDPPGSATIRLHGGTAFAGTLFSSTALIDNQGTPDIYGAITGKEFPANGNFAFHYDESLGGSRHDFVASFEPDVWRVVRD